MRFEDYDPAYALLRFSDGRPIKVDANDAAQLPNAVYEFNDRLFALLLTAFENNDYASLGELWAAAHPRVLS